MRVALQRVSEAQVKVEEAVVGSIGHGLLILVAFSEGDSEETLRWMSEKLTGLRVFRDEEGKMNRSLVEAGGSLLVVSQFTLYGDARKGRRPSFVGSAPPEIAEPLYRRFLDVLRESGVRVEAGVFGAMMQIHLINDGPVTLIIDR